MDRKPIEVSDNEDGGGGSRIFWGQRILQVGLKRNISQRVVKPSSARGARFHNVIERYSRGE